MRRSPFLLVLLLAACGSNDMTRNFSMSRDAAPETMAATQMPLSMPPSLTARPIRPSTLGAGRGGAQEADQAAGSVGQNALLEAAGPPADANIRTVINQKSGLVYPGPAFVDQLMNWQRPPGQAPIITQWSGGGWFSRMF